VPAFLLGYSARNPIEQVITVDTIRDYINSARTLLQDTTGAPRYSDDQFKLALNLAFDEAYRIRPDMFIRNEVPDLSEAGVTTSVPVPRGYQSAFLYYICGMVQLQDQEDTQDNRATVFLNKFVSQLLTTSS
jgi:hypothetical protein